MFLWPFWAIFLRIVSAQVPIGTVMVAQQQNPPTTSPIIPLVGSENGAINELVDQVCYSFLSIVSLPD